MKSANHGKLKMGSGERDFQEAEKSVRPQTLPLPCDGPLLSLTDVAAYLRRTPAAVRKLLDGRRNSDDGEIGEILRRCVVKLSPHRTYIARGPFLEWLGQKVGKVRIMEPSGSD